MRAWAPAVCVRACLCGCVFRCLRLQLCARVSVCARARVESHLAAVPAHLARLKSVPHLVGIPSRAGYLQAGSLRIHCSARASGSAGSSRRSGTSRPSRTTRASAWAACRTRARCCASSIPFLFTHACAATFLCCGRKSIFRQRANRDGAFTAHAPVESAPPCLQHVVHRLWCHCTCMRSRSSSRLVWRWQ